MRNISIIRLAANEDENHVDVRKYTAQFEKLGNFFHISTEKFLFNGKKPIVELSWKKIKKERPELIQTYKERFENVIADLEQLRQDVINYKIIDNYPNVFLRLCAGLNQYWGACLSANRNCPNLIIAIYDQILPIKQNNKSGEEELDVSKIAGIELESMYRNLNLRAFGPTSLGIDELKTKFNQTIQAHEITAKQAKKALTFLLEVQDYLRRPGCSIIAHQQYVNVLTDAKNIFADPAYAKHEETYQKHYDELKAAYERPKKTYNKYISTDLVNKYINNYVYNYFGNDMLNLLQEDLASGKLMESQIRTLIDALITVSLKFSSLIKSDSKITNPQILNNLTRYDNELINNIKKHRLNVSYVQACADSVNNYYSIWNVNRRNIIKNTERYDIISSNDFVEINVPTSYKQAIRQYKLDEFLQFPSGTIEDNIFDCDQKRKKLKNKGPFSTTAWNRIINALINLKEQQSKIDAYIKQRLAAGFEVPDYLEHYKTWPKEFFLNLYERDSLNDSMDLHNPYYLLKAIRKNITEANKEAKNGTFSGTTKVNEEGDINSLQRSLRDTDFSKSYSVVDPQTGSLVDLDVINYHSNVGAFEALAVLRGKDGKGISYKNDYNEDINPWAELIAQLLNIQTYVTNNPDVDKLWAAKKQEKIISTWRRKCNDIILSMKAETDKNALLNKCLKILNYTDEQVNFLKPYRENVEAYVDKHGCISILVVALQKLSPFFEKILANAADENFYQTEQADPEPAYNKIVDVVGQVTADFKSHKIASFLTKEAQAIKPYLRMSNECKGLVAMYPGKAWVDKFGNSFQNLLNNAATAGEDPYKAVNRIMRNTSHYEGHKVKTSKGYVTSDTVFKYFQALAFCSVKEGTVDKYTGDVFGYVRRSVVNPNNLTPEQKAEMKAQQRVKEMVTGPESKMKNIERTDPQELYEKSDARSEWEFDQVPVNSYIGQRK